MYKRIVIATDGSRHAQMALETGFRFSEMLKLKSSVVTVMDLLGPFELFLDDTRIEKGEDEALRKTFETQQEVSQKILADVSNLAGKKGRDVETILLRGSPVQQLLNFAHEYDLLLIGAHGKDAKKKFGTGSVAEKLVRHMPCDVFVVRKKEPCKKILIALAGSKQDEVITEKGLAIAQLLGASVCAVHVVTAKEIWRKEMDRTLVVERVKEKGDRMGIKVKTMVVRGHPTPKLISLSARHDLVVMGTLGVTSLPDLLIGSTAERVMRHAQSSVLVVRSPGFVA